MGIARSKNANSSQQTHCSCTPDGGTESFNEAGEEFGERRLVEAFRRHRGQPSESLIALIVEEMRQYNPREQQDDITLIVAHCRENPTVA
jgi:serine phosphatase RsbU (regulator of sigma subunit)